MRLRKQVLWHSAYLAASRRGRNHGAPGELTLPGLNLPDEALLMTKVKG